MPDEEKDEFEAAFAAAAGEEVEPVADDATDETEPEVQEQEPGDSDADAPDEPLAPAAETIEIGGKTYQTSELAPYMEFAEWARQDPDRWNELVEFSEGKKILTVPPAVFPDEPEILDPDEQIRVLSERVTAAEAREAARTQSETAWAIADGTDKFKAAHPAVTEEELAQVLQAAGRLKIIQAIRENDPALPQAEVARQAFEAAYRVEFFDRHRTEAGAKVVKDMRSRKRAAHAGATSASVSRSPTVPTTPAEEKDAFVSAVAEAMDNA